MPKFDVAIMNPPYDRNLHLKILEKVISIAEKVVNISPIRWLQEPFAKYQKSSDYNKFEESISKKIETLDIIDAKTASTIFDASFTMNLGIYVCGNGGFVYSELINKIIKKLAEKVIANNWLPYSPKKYYNNMIVKKQFSLDIAPIRGEQTSGYDIMCTTYERQCETVPMNKETAYDNQGGHFEFDTEEERRNFYDCYTHPFMKWYYKNTKYNAHNYSIKIPYFGDYTKPWITKMFCEYFGITGFISDTEAVPGSEWEEILNTMKDFNS